MIKEYTLGDCVEMIIDYRGKTPQKMGGDWVDNGYRVISALNVHGGFIDNEDQIRCVSQEIYEKWMKDEIKRNDCFLASEGASLGENTIWDSDEKIVLGQRLYAIRTNPDKLDPWYFAMYMQTKKFRQQIDQISTGSTVFGISQPVLLSVKLLLPNIIEQRKIGALYRNIYHKLKNTNSICSDLDSIAKLLYDYWFVQFDFPDENGRPYKSSGGKMVWNAELKREIPEGWEDIVLNKIAQIITESVKPVSNEYYYHYSIPAFDEGMYPREEFGSSIDSNKYLVLNDYVLVSKLNPQFKRVWNIYLTGENSICSTEFMPFISKTNEKEFMYSVLNSDSFYTFMVNSSSSSTGSRKRMQPDLCNNYKLAYPRDNRVIQMYCEKTKAIFEESSSFANGW